jgi:30S ribosomal protein S31
MGKGDRKSRRGKIFMGSYGVSRKKRKATKAAYISTNVKPEAKIVSKPIPSAKVKDEEKVVEEIVIQEQVVVEPEIIVPEIEAETEEIKSEEITDTTKKPKAKAKTTAKKEKTEKKEPAKKKAPKKEKE